MKAAPSTLDLTPNLNREASQLESWKIMPHADAHIFAARAAIHLREGECPCCTCHCDWSEATSLLWGLSLGPASRRSSATDRRDAGGAIQS